MLNILTENYSFMLIIDFLKYIIICSVYYTTFNIHVDDSHTGLLIWKKITWFNIYKSLIMPHLLIHALNHKYTDILVSSHD